MFTRQWLTIVLVVAALVRPAEAQEQAPAIEVFGGYSLLPANGDDFPRATSHGVQVGVTVNVSRRFGIVGDCGAQFSSSSDLGPGFQGRVARTTVTECFVGPRFTARSERVNVFGHGLVGLAAGDAGDGFEGFSDTKVAFGGGGGVDVRIQSRFALRAQYDLIGSFADIVEGNSRFALGLVVSFGGS